MKTYDPNVESTARSLRELAKQLDPPRHVWLMVPSGKTTEDTVEKLLGVLEPGDTIIDGGNSNFRDSQRRAAEARKAKLAVRRRRRLGRDLGARGRLLPDGGRRQGAGAAAGPIFDALAPEDGWAHVGASGAGHFTKMVHNGIEYGLMQAYAEGFELMQQSEFELDLSEIAGIWRYGSVVRSWLLDLLHGRSSRRRRARRHRAVRRGLGRGALDGQRGIATRVPVPAIARRALRPLRLAPRDRFSAKVQAALRNQFGGHAVKAVEGKRSRGAAPK